MVLMAGFTAGNEKGELVVLGRNGSDYSAAVLAACMRADCCEIWTDVDGVYTCDPRQVPDARLLKSMSYQEAMELSYFGAKVLHPRTIAPIAQFQIPCLIKNTGNPQAPGTLIGASLDEDGLPVKGSRISTIWRCSTFPGQNEGHGWHGGARLCHHVPCRYLCGADYPILFGIQHQLLRAAKRLRSREAGDGR